MKNLLLFNLFLISLLIPQISYAQEIGSVTSIDGIALKLLPERQSTLIPGSPIELNDTILTQSKSSIIITFNDNTVLALGEGTQLKIDEYVYSEAEPEKNKAEFTVLKGPFHYISGLIAKKEEPDVTLNLDFGSIGIRGTKIWRDMTMTDDGKLQCRIYVEDGKARVSNGKGFTTLGHGDGSRIVGRLAPPTSSKPWGEAAIKDIKSKSPVVQIAEAPTKEPEPEQESETPQEAAPQEQENAPAPAPATAPAPAPAPAPTPGIE